MNITFALGLAAIFVFTIGILVGLSMNGRAQIARDKSQAEIQRELNAHRRALQLVSRSNHERRTDMGYPHRSP